jgi:hypothetical protein
MSAISSPERGRITVSGFRIADDRRQEPFRCFEVAAAHAVERCTRGRLLSTWQDRTIDFPLDGAAYARALEEKIAAART